MKAREAVSVAIETISQKSSVFEARKLKEYALKHTLTGADVVTSRAIDKAIKENKTPTAKFAKVPAAIAASCL